MTSAPATEEQAAPAVTNKEPEEPPKVPKPPLEIGYKGLQFTNLDELWRFCDIISRTKSIPEHYQNKPAECLAAIQYGLEVGIPPMAALRSIKVVNGMPSMWGDGLLALCHSSPAFDWSRWAEREVGSSDELPIDTKEWPDSYRWECVCARLGQTTPTARSFSVGDARRAQLWDNVKKIYGKYPWRMLQMRARGFALRDTFAKELGGMQSREELEHQQLVENALAGVALPDSAAGAEKELTAPPAPKGLLTPTEEKHGPDCHCDRCRHARSLRGEPATPPEPAPGEPALPDTAGNPVPSPIAEPEKGKRPQLEADAALDRVRKDILAAKQHITDGAFNGICKKRGVRLLRGCTDATKLGEVLKDIHDLMDNGRTVAEYLREVAAEEQPGAKRDPGEDAPPPRGP